MKPIDLIFGPIDTTINERFRLVGLVCINGSPRRPSRTGRLVECIGRAILARTSAQRFDVALAHSGTALLSGLDRASLSPDGEAICRKIEAADVLVVASPVYRASYTGVLKHLFDLVDRDAMRGKIAVLAATGGTPLHGLMIEHQLRPLMGFFAVQTTATTLYGLEDEIGLDGAVAPALAKRAAQAADEVACLIEARQSRRAMRMAA